MVFVVALTLTACSSKEPEAGSETPGINLSSLPVTVEGVLVADVAEGDVDEEGTSEFNFGTLTAGENELLIEVSGALLQSAGIPEEGARVRATLGSKSERFGANTYTITSLSRL
jgi:hypothetical protein